MRGARPCAKYRHGQAGKTVNKERELTSAPLPQPRGRANRYSVAFWPGVGHTTSGHSPTPLLISSL